MNKSIVGRVYEVMDAAENKTLRVEVVGEYVDGGADLAVTITEPGGEEHYIEFNECTCPADVTEWAQQQGFEFADADFVEYVIDSSMCIADRTVDEAVSAALSRME